MKKIRCCGNWLCADCEHWTHDTSKAGIFSFHRAAFILARLKQLGKIATLV